MNTDRIEQIQKETAYPESVSVQQALLKVWNETEQDRSHQTSEADVRLNGLLSGEELQRVTTLAMEKAVALGMVPRFSCEESYLMHWDNMTELVKTIVAVE
jgi:hypothetical protein